ncbi:hypothetical protein SAMN05443245_6115 [Paraburkholderia fungorum]|uniref:Uncharacterized protein n=1 Tax=Paraburkholderia fungorum TaxID=134537 RepID=A0A1H1JDE5_9BURK|nr:hypothetical protein [Paraburkholderia fungorum]SDR47951.1 hypothetical protein SAMN05443245_6115 [Paraburkholderia fungorum]
METYRAHAAAPATATQRHDDPATESSLELVEVWGDTVDLRHLAWSVVLGTGISIGAFFAGQRLLSAFVPDAAIARAYAMLVGLAGCLVAGMVCAFLFKPKREVVEHAVNPAERMRVLDQLAAESGGLGTVADLSPAARAEMDELGLLDLFAAYEREHAHERHIDEANRPADLAMSKGAH